MKNIVFLTLSLFVPLIIWGQSLDTLRGVIKDSKGNPIPGANVMIYLKSDTLHKVSNENGQVKFPILFHGGVLIKATSLAYEEGRVSIIAGQKYFEIILNEKTNMLREVIVKGIVNPIVVKVDTVEYDVSHFVQDSSDVIHDILARLPGLQVNPDGTISMMGQRITKIRINGQDFLVDDIKTLTSIIPASLISKIQLIDDYGEQSRLAGRKSGESQKIINLSTRSDIIGFYAARLVSSIGTEGLYSLNSNFFKFNSEQSLNFSLSNSNISRYNGPASNTEGNFSFKKNFGKTISLNTNFNYKYNSTEIETKSNQETIISEGILQNKINSIGKSSDNYYKSAVELTYSISERSQILLRFNGKFDNSKFLNQIVNLQTGFQKKDQFTTNVNLGKQYGNNGELTFLHKFKKRQRALYFQISIGTGEEDKNLNADNKLKFYSLDSSTYSDSLLHQIIIDNNKNREYKSKLSYVDSLGKYGTFEVSYSYVKSFSNNNHNTNWMNEDGIFVPIDSLSNAYNYSVVQHQIEINYQKRFGFFEYTIGCNVRPFSILGNNHKSGIPIFPVFQMSYNKLNDVVFKINYSGDNVFPSYRQFSMIPDYTDIQNPIYGNPGLKAAQRHNISFNLFKNYRLNTLLFKLSANTIKNNIVSDIVLVEDGLGSVKQETHFLNSNGNYSIEFTNGWTRTLPNNKGNYLLELSGNYSNNILYYNGLKEVAKSKALFNRAWISYTLGSVDLNMGAIYSISRSEYSINSNDVTTHNIRISSNNQIKFTKNFIWEVSAIKQFNFGFGSSLIPNSFLLDIRINKWWLKRKIITALEGNNLLNGGASVTQSTKNNIISATTFNSMGRTIFFKLIFDIHSH